MDVKVTMKEFYRVIVKSVPDEVGRPNRGQVRDTKIVSLERFLHFDGYH